MKKVECDGCRKQVAADSIYGNPPREWVTAKLSGDSVDSHFCSVDCLTKTAQQRKREAVRG